MTLLLEDYRLMMYFHEEKHITRFHNIEPVKRDLATGDPATLLFIAKFLQAEERMKEASDALTRRLLDVINEMEEELPEADY